MDLDSNAKNNEFPFQNNENCIKFGEIILGVDGKFVFICNFCNEIFSKSISLTGHVIEKHVTTEIETIKEAFSTNANDFEKIENYLLNKLTAKVEIENSDSNNLNFTEPPNKDPSCKNSQDTKLNQKTEKITPPKSSPLKNELTPKRSETKNMNQESILESSKTEQQENKKKRIRLLNGEVNWQCPLCNVVLKCTSKYDHLKRHKGTKTFKCKHCSEEYSTTVQRRNHEKIHTGEVERPIKCPDCPKNFKSKVILTAHIRRFHLGLREHKCDYCDKKYFSNTEKMNHERLNHTKEEERPYECSQCDNKYKVAQYLRDHIKRTHLKIRNYKCNLCDKAFFSNPELKKHEICWHSKLKPCVCEICGLSFATTQQLRNHHLSRHDEPKLQCSVCDKKFHTKRGLSAHQDCHKDNKPYQCKVCLTRFPRQKSYTRHMVLHSGVKDYVCKLCGKAFAHASGIACHMKSHGIKYNACNVIRKSRMDNENKQL